METYRSGHNGADSKSVCRQRHVGSNPTVSAKKGPPGFVGVLFTHAGQVQTVDDSGGLHNQMKEA